MNGPQFWTKNHKRVLRVQQSMHGPYRVVSIKPEDAVYCWVSKYNVPAWAADWRDERDATNQLLAHTKQFKLERRPES